MSVDTLQFQTILNAARNREAAEGVSTMVVAAHLAQMRLFMIRQGVEFFARQDTFSQRREFIRRVVEYNHLPSRLEAICDSFLIDGRGLFYFRPSRDLYRIHFFTKDQYRSYYDEEGELEEVEIIYSIYVKPQRGFGQYLSDTALQSELGTRINRPGSEIRWVRLRVRADKITQQIGAQRFEFGEDIRTPTAVIGQAPQEVENSLGFIPAVEVFNSRALVAGEGYGEFDWLSSYILEHNRMANAIKENLQFFGNPTLVSSRPKHDLVEADGTQDVERRSSVAAASGFRAAPRVSVRSAATIGPGASAGGGLRVPRIIANVEAADRVGYITPDSVSGDATQYAQVYQEAIRSALGGVDDLSISSSASAFEVKTLYGRVATTAKRKCRDLYEYGLCRIFSMMMLHEETLFRESLSYALGFPKPEPVLAEDYPEDAPGYEVGEGGEGGEGGGETEDDAEGDNEEGAAEPVSPREQAVAQYNAAMDQWREMTHQAILQVKETGEVPPQAVGLIPDGDTRVEWRWMGDIFPDTPREILDNSIVCRNLQELGVSSIEALQYLFPDKTPEERAAMLTGYPFRMVEAVQRSLGIFMDLQRGFFQTPNPQEPDYPLAADPALDLVPYLHRSLQTLQRELSYSATYSNVDPTAVPDVLSDADRLRARLGRTTELEREREQRRRDASARAAGRLGADWRMGSSGPGGLQPDATNPVPGLGGTLWYDPVRPDAGPAGELAGPGSAPFGGMGAPDLRAPSNFGLPYAGPTGPAGPAGGGFGAPGAGPAPGAAPVPNGSPGGARRPGRPASRRAAGR